ncbi:hypothetical protein Leryth_006169 [Lithospermum erythrorhizon]|nr:hypothetical protein Leryth_006169 [Lithospermum erythrorhizon]
MQSENGTHNNVHIIDIQRNDDTVYNSRITTQELQHSGALDPPNNQNHVEPASRADPNHPLRSPIVSRLWILVELCIIACQIMALVIALLISRHEKVGVPLFVWVVGYGLGCLAAVPVLCWHYYNICKTIERNANLFHNPNESSSTHPLDDGALNNVSSTIEDENQDRTGSTSSSIQHNESSSLRTSRRMSMALDAFFAVWFVYGNVCLLGGYASPVDAPIMYQLCLIFVILSYIGYAMPLILCGTICCFLPCIFSAIESQEEYQTRGASAECINALPTYKFKLKGNNDAQHINNEQKELNVLASQKDENEALSKDLACCVCLTEFEDDEEMRELPCLHFFHVECIDTWLKINATCPLCKFEIGLSDGTSPPTSNSNNHNS